MSDKEQEVTTTAAEPEVTTTETVPEVVETKPQRDIELETLREKIAKYEQLVVSPEYADFLAAKAAEKVAAQQGTKPKEYSADEKRAFEEKLNNMTRAQFAAFVRDLTVETVKEQMFDPVMSTIVTDKVKTQIAETATRFPDYWDYKPEMVSIANANPSLNAEQVYHLAKAQRGVTTVPAGKPPVRKPAGETPSGVPASRSEKAPDNFNAAFEQAFKKVGL